MNLRASIIVAFTTGALPSTVEAPPLKLVERVPFRKQGGRAETQWVAPYVEYAEIRINREKTSRVRWVAPSGQLIAETDSLEPKNPYYFVSETDKLSFYGMYGDWTLAAASDETYGVASRDGRNFIQFSRAGRKPIGIVVHSMGVLVSTLGPVPGMQLQSHSLNWDGSVAALFSPVSGVGRPELMATNARGGVEFSRSLPNAKRVHVAPMGEAPFGGTMMIYYLHFSFQHPARLLPAGAVRTDGTTAGYYQKMNRRKASLKKRILTMKLFATCCISAVIVALLTAGLAAQPRPRQWREPLTVTRGPVNFQFPAPASRLRVCAFF